MRAIVGIGLVALAACASTPDTVVLPANEQYALAVSRFEAEEYTDAVTALQTFVFNYPQDPRIPEARWMTARAYDETEDWATAAQEYLNYQRSYPAEPRAAAALAAAAAAYQEMSLRPELDQRDTERAINVYERLLTEYPQSELVEEARAARARLRDKLAEKVYLNAAFYFGNEDYKAAELYLADLIAHFTDSSWMPAGYALLARTFCAQGLGDRAMEVATRLRETYPDSEASGALPDTLASACRPVAGRAAAGAVTAVR
ncbi:MAG: outer membrane protein assembly factor BamD [Gemmatimonadota bacterium]